MRHVSSTKQLLSDGFSHGELARLIRSGELVRVRRGAYAGSHGDWAPDRHRQLIEATAGLWSPGSVVSHLSAAALWGLPLPMSSLDQVQLTRPEVDSGKRRGNIHLYVAALDPSEMTMLAGYPGTTLARTVVDLARSLPLAQAVIPGDAALRAGLTRSELDAGLLLAGGRRGIIRARRTAEFLDGRSESPGESMSRALVTRTGLPSPDLQREIIDQDGCLVGRVDFLWDAQQTVGEFDGKVKYGGC